MLTHDRDIPKHDYYIERNQAVLIVENNILKEENKSMQEMIKMMSNNENSLVEKYEVEK